MTGIERRALRFFGRFERPAAWVLCAGAVATFVGAAVGLIATGNLRPVTLIACADLALGGYGALRDAYDKEEETG